MKRFGLFVFFLFVPLLAHSQSPTVEYKLGMSKPWTHIFEVELTYDGLPSREQTLDLILPTWRSGRYVIFDLAGNVIEFSAVDGNNNPLSWSKADKSTWRVQKLGAKKVRARYTVFANDFTSRKNGVNDEHAFVNGAGVFMYVEPYRRIPVKLRVIPYKDWHVTTGLESINGDPFQFTAPTYDYLLDCPLEIGNQTDIEFVVEDTKHVISIYGRGNWNADTLKRDIGKIVKANKNFWGDLPYRRYMFLVHLTPQGGGGTEYLNSTILSPRPFNFENPAAYRGFLGLVSHEFFHTWNVKQLRPKGMHPYDYTKENYAKEYWIAEGTTSYYGPRMMISAGFSRGKQFVEGLAAAIQEDRLRPGNKVQSLSESSFDAWIKQNKPGDHSYNTQTEFYGKGSHVSLLLDLEIRYRSNNNHSLDDVMRTMYKRFPITGGGYTIDDFQRAAEDYAGGSLRQFFDGYVHGTKPLDWERSLGYAGLEVHSRDSDRKSWLGAYTTDQGEKTRIARVVAGSPAYEAGLDVGDEVLALNGLRVRTVDLQERIGISKAGETVKITIFRDDKLREFDVTLRLQDVPPYRIQQVVRPTPLQKAIYESWLNTTWE